MVWRAYFNEAPITKNYGLKAWVAYSSGVLSQRWVLNRRITKIHYIVDIIYVSKKQNCT